jgi:ABC-type sugar transport system permease subunit
VHISIITAKECHTTDLFLVILFLPIIIVVIVIVVVVAVFLIVRIAILFKILSCLLFTLHAPFSKLFHHLEKLLPIILEKVVCNGENVACEVVVAL